jgi:hypothetical protein
MLLDRNGDRFLIDGWGPAGRDAAGPFRPIVASRARVVFPLRPDERGWEVILVTTLRDGTASAADIDVEINDHHVGRVRTTSPAPAEVRITIPASDVGRVLRAGYNRLAIVTSPGARIAIHRLRIAPTA